VSDDTETRVLSEAESAPHSSGTWPSGAAVNLEPGDTIGRYEIEGRLGSGGMGVVYAALDPELDRRVALKLLRPSSGQDTTRAEARGRLVREAQAMAKLSHPNVLPVYDVGMVDERVFVAMELVVGQTLAQWLSAGSRSAEAITTTMIAAGRGLVAAHEAGLVHRDFKPANVMLGDDGRVYVMDFGLARPTGDTESEASGASLTVSVDDNLTKTGFVMGTPAYMAPEQHRGEPAEPATDQWAFCVTLYEALAGKRPFRGKTRAELIRAIEGSALEDLPTPINASKRVYRALRRGLALHPEDRHASMESLLAELEPARPKRAGWALLGLGGLFAVGWSAWPGGANDDADCDAAAVGIDALWSSDTQETIAAKFEASGVSWAEDSWSRASALLNDYASDWSAMRVETCEAARVRKTQTDAVMDLRMACLDGRRDAVAELLDVFRQADRPVIDRAVHMVAGLPDLEHCADVATLQTDAMPVTDPGRQREIAAVDAELERASVLRRSSRYQDAVVIARNVLPRAEALDHPPTQVSALRILGGLEVETGSVDEGLARLEQAAWLAEEHGRDADVANIAAVILHALVTHRPDPSRLDRWAELAQAKVDRVGRGGKLEAHLLARLGDAADAKADYETARTYANEALARWKSLAPNGYDHARAIANVGKTYFREENWPRAQTLFVEAADMMAAALGERNPEVARVRGNIAVAAHAAGDYARAKREQLAILPLFIELFGEQHASVAVLLTNLGNAHYRLGEHEQALAVSQRAAAIKRVVYGEGTSLAYSLNNVAMTLLALDRHDDAAVRYEEAIDMLSVEDNPALSHALEGLGEVRWQQGELEEAERLVRRALEIEESADTPMTSRVPGTFMLAEILWDGGRHDDARTLVRTVQGWAREAEDRDRSMRNYAQRADTWLEEHG